MIQDRLWLEVGKVAARYERLRFWRALSVGWLVAAVIGLSLNAVGVLTAQFFGSPPFVLENDCEPQGASRGWLETTRG